MTRPRKANTLTQRQTQVLQLVAEGYKNQEIADQLFLVKVSVDAHLQQIYRQLAVDNRMRAVLKAQRLGLLQVQEGQADATLSQA